MRSILALCLVALSFTIVSHAEEDRFRVVTTFTLLADMAQNVAGDAALVQSITKPGAEIHNYQPTPRDIEKAHKADLILWNGLNLELWFKKFFAELNDVPAVVLTEGIDPMSITQGPYDGKPNPHAWMSASDALIYVTNIEQALSQFDPDNAEIYRKNAELYRDEIASAFDPIREDFAELPENRRWLVTSEGAFSYFARDFGLKELFLWPINADARGKPKQIRHVIKTIRKENIPAIFSESTVSPEPARLVAKESGAEYGGVLYVDSLSEADGPVPTYLDLLRLTSHTILEALSAD